MTRESKFLQGELRFTVNFISPNSCSGVRNASSDWGLPTSSASYSRGCLGRAYTWGSAPTGAGTGPTPRHSGTCSVTPQPWCNCQVSILAVQQLNGGLGGHSFPVSEKELRDTSSLVCHLTASSGLGRMSGIVLRSQTVDLSAWCPWAWPALASSLLEYSAHLSGCHCRALPWLLGTPHRFKPFSSSSNNLKRKVW